MRESESEPHVSVPHGRRLHDDAVSFSSSSPLSFLLCRLLPTTAASVLQQQPSLSLSPSSAAYQPLSATQYSPRLFLFTGIHFPFSGHFHFAQWHSRA